MEGQKETGFLERRFGLRAAGTTVRREVGAGLATFFTLSYILFVQPQILGLTGMDPGGVLFATCVASAIACFAMGLLANHPFGLAPAMGHNAFFAFVACGAMGLTWQEALAANLVAGVLFLLLSSIGFRRAVLEALPPHLQSAIAAGIGLLIAFVGLQWAGIVVDDPVLLVGLGELGRPTTLLAVFGLALLCALVANRVPAAVLWTVLATAGVGWLAQTALEPSEPLVRGLPEGRGVLAFPSPAATALQLDFAALFSRPVLEAAAVIAVFFVLDLFDSIGTLVGLADRTGSLVDGRIPRAERALAADALGTVAGAALGTSTVTTYVESAAGIEGGGRTGLTAITVGVCMLAALVLSPVLTTVGAGVDVGVAGAPALRFPVIAPVLIYVGAMMMGALSRVEWGDLTQAIPVFLTMIGMQMTVSITDGIAWGTLSTAFLALVTGRPRSVSPLLHGLALLFAARYVWMDA